MTEAEWLAASDPNKMLRFLRGRASTRKLRLFACACVRRIWHLLEHDKEAREDLELVERYADGMASKREFDARVEDLGDESSQAREVKDESGRPLEMILYESCASYAAFLTWETAYRVQDSTMVETRRAVEQAARGAAKHAALAMKGVAQARGAKSKARDEAVRAERRDQCQVLRDLIGNPFHPVTREPQWLAWDGGTVPKLAGTIYEERAFDRLPILADALEDAGCTDPEILSHCRVAGVHVLGCWLLDLLLGKV